MSVESQKIVHTRFAQPSAGLFDTILVAIKHEEESRKARKILLTFVSFLLLSVIALISSLSVNELLPISTLTLLLIDVVFLLFTVRLLLLHLIKTTR